MKVVIGLENLFLDGCTEPLVQAQFYLLYTIELRSSEFLKTDWQSLAKKAIAWSELLIVCQNYDLVT